MSSFKQSLAKLKTAFIAGLPERAKRIEAAMERADRDAVRREAHRIKGTAGSYDLYFLGECAAAVEGANRESFEVFQPMVIALLSAMRSPEEAIETSVQDDATIPDAARPGAAAKLALIEDEPAVARMLSLSIERMTPHTVVVFNDAETALAAIDSSFDLIITDAMLPAQSGADLLRQLRERELRMPAIVASAAAEGGLDWPADRLSRPDAWFQKPVDIKELIARVSELLVAVRVRV